MNPNSPSPSPKRSFSLIDAICIIVGTIIGAGIFKTSPMIANFAGSFEVLVAVWIVGGVVAFIGAACFAELTTSHPNEVGGDYVYLKRAYGRPFGFMFAWASFWIIRPGNIGAMAMVFAIYLSQIVPISATYLVVYALVAVIALSLTNLVGLRQGKLTQNILTFAKVSGIGAIVLLACLFPHEATDAAVNTATNSESGSSSSFWLAMLFVMFSYGGWNDISLVAGEVRDPHRNLFRSLFLGILTVMLVYLAFNVALIYGLGFEAMSHSDAVATDLVRQVFGPESLVGQRSGQLIAALVCVSCLGAINGMIFTSPRIYYAVGQDYRALKPLAAWNEERECPWQGIVFQTCVTVGLILLCIRYPSAFDVLVVSTAPYFWGFLGLTVAALVVLRMKEKTGDGESPRENASDSRQVTSSFRVPLYPLEPIFFTGVCAVLTYSAIRHLITEKQTLPAMIVGGIMVVGVILSLSLKTSDERGV